MNNSPAIANDPNVPNFSNAEPVDSEHPHPGAGHEKACGAVIVKDSAVLLVSQQNGLTGFPKGHVEPGETEFETALREVQEETGLSIILDPATRHSFGYYIPRLNVEKEVVLFLAQLDLSSAALHKQESEIAGAAWVPFAEVETKLNFPEWRKAWRNIYQLYLQK